MSVEEKNTLTGKLLVPDAIHGKSAYEIAVAHGFDGTEEEWLYHIKGKSAYELAVEHGYVGDEDKWLAEITANADKAVEANDKAEATLAEINRLLEEYVGDVATLVGGD